MQKLPPILDLSARREQFRAFLVNRVGNEADADDILQNGLLKAMHASETLHDQEKLVAWFYRLLRNSIIDHVRARNASSLRDEAWQQQLDLTGNEPASAVVCLCYKGLLPKLSERESALLQRVELNDESVATVAADMGVSANAASIALHRARTKLRAHLVEFCGSCSSSGCRDCQCQP